MSKKVNEKPLKTVITSITDTPETTLGKVLFARRSAESIVQILNNISDYVIVNNVTLDTQNEEVAGTLNTLNSLVQELNTRISQLV